MSAKSSRKPPRSNTPSVEDVHRQHTAGAAGAHSRFSTTSSAATSSSAKLEGNKPGRLGEGPAGDQHDPARRGARRDQAR